MNVARILLVDDHAIISDTLAVALSARGHDVRVPADLALEAVVELGRNHDPHLVLLDYQLDGATGLELLAPLRDLGAAVIMLTAVDDVELLARCIEAGAVGIVNKQKGLAPLLDAVDAVVEGRSPMRAGEVEELLAAARRSRAANAPLSAAFDSLTPRERVVLQGIVAGATADQIAAAEFVSVTTVRSQIRSILRKLGVSSQLAAAALAREVGWEG